jgi:hypothetical protein
MEEFAETRAGWEISLQSLDSLNIPFGVSTTLRKQIFIYLSWLPRPVAQAKRDRERKALRDDAMKAKEFFCSVGSSSTVL